MSKKIRMTAAFLLMLVLCAIVGTAQQSPTDIYIVKSDGNAGELNSAYLDSLINRQQSSNERIFVIARLGRGETTRSLNEKRLQAACYFLLETKRVSQDQIVFAEGNPVSGEGRIEFYLGGKLMLVSLAARGKNVSLNCCGADEPPPKKKVRKNKT